jgi:hypothetical protein
MPDSKLSRELVNSLTSLYIDHSWLGEKSNELIELMDFSDSIEQQQVLLKLLRLFEYLTPKRYQDCLATLAAQIHDVWALREENTMLVSSSADEEADSGQVILYDLRTQLTNRGWRQTVTVNVFGKAQRRIADRPNVILIDEFLGTGRSLIGRIQELQRHFSARGVAGYKIIPCVIAAMEFGKTNVKQTVGYDVYSVKTCQKGISDLFPEAERAGAKDTMLVLEAKLARIFAGSTLPSFGDGESESVYGRFGGNCPIENYVIHDNR